MKNLKLDHDLAQKVLHGEKTSTWRLFDDKDLTVNDQIELIDKVVVDQPQTWKVIGTARITRIIEKRVDDIRPEDYEGHGSDSSETAEERLSSYRHYYGDRVTWSTPIKMIHFDFTPGTSHPDHLDTQPRQLIGERVILYADGGSRGNPGPSACGYVLLDKNEEVLIDKGVYLGITTNNQAEYQGLKNGLEEAHKMGARQVDVRLDSMLVVNQMKGIFKVKNRDLWPIHQAVVEMVGTFEKVTFTHVPRELNKLADSAVNRALDEAATEL
jgi:ribonuclease HI